ncbi:MAG: LPS export ABC transporter periplasmic protein LptC [Cyclobacteriaceae bacterium]|jgi:LPS export ABC transporter protein LptC
MKNGSLILLVVSLVWACAKPENQVPEPYTGPMRVAEHVDMLYHEKNQLKIKLIAKKILEHQNGDREFPEGVYLEFYDERGELQSTLQANEAFYFKEENKWRGRGNVIVINLQKNQQLNTEELFWKPDTKRIFTEKFVNIKLDQEVIYGTGLEAAQDMSEYEIKKTEGEFLIRD